MQIKQPLHLLSITLGSLLLIGCHSVPISKTQQAWIADLGNGTYQNPVINADYSDPDAIRVGDTYYMTSSSFNSTPGLPLLQSKDMVNWELVGHALTQQIPADIFAKPQHGKGVWAPCLRYHENKFWIFYPDPDFGIYVITAEKFSGPWSEPHLLLAGKGIIDPTPLWDDDGQAYLLHAWAKSRSGINNLLTLRKMNSDATKMLDNEGKVVIDGNKIPNYKTLEGPKFYKHNGYYYVFAPAGGVEAGWQSVFRAKNIDGPYEDKIVMEQGSSSTNGPHQGAWVQTPDGTDWFYHFQDKRAYGRVVHLQPMHWQDDWPVIGEDKNNTGIGEPVIHYRKPILGHFAIANPATSDEFAQPSLGSQWQWNANWKSEWYSLTENRGHLRLFSQYDMAFTQQHNLWDTPALLLQKLPAEKFAVNTSIDINKQHAGTSTGLIMYGFDYAWLGVKSILDKNQLVFATCEKTEAKCVEQIHAAIDVKQSLIYLRMVVNEGGNTEFFYSLDNKNFTQIGKPFTAVMGRWVGAQMGLFSVNENQISDNNGYVDVDYFRVTAN